MADTAPSPHAVAARALMQEFYAAYDGRYTNGEWMPNREAQVAAVLRALAEGVNGATDIRAEILRIAAELEDAANG